MYHGTTEDVVGYFSRNNLECPSFVNPADFLLDLLEIDEEADVFQVLCF